MYVVFKCRRCEHQLYMLEQSLSVKALDKLSEHECPKCGEEGYENWILVGTAAKFPGEEDEDEDEEYEEDEE